MNKTKIGIFFSLLLLIGLTSCGEQKSNNKLMLNEVLIDNQSNFQDDYGLHSAWIEVFNKSYGSADLAGCLLKVSNQPGDTVTYFIPKGDVLTLVKPRQHALFWADGEPNRGTFHVNFTLDPSKENYIALYDADGKSLIDEITIPAAQKPDVSYGRIIDGKEEWAQLTKVTPSTNNLTLDSNEKIENFKTNDSLGIGMTITAMAVVFLGLLLLFLIFKQVGKAAIAASKRNAQKAGAPVNVNTPDEVSGEVFAAIATALYEMSDDNHDIEHTVLTIRKVRRAYSPWSSKIYSLRETPRK